LGELSQIPAATEISSFKEEHILTIVKNLSTSLEILEESRFYELQNDFPCQNEKEAKKLWTTSCGEKSLRPDIEDFSTSISAYPLCTSEINHPEEKDLHSMMKERVHKLLLMNIKITLKFGFKRSSGHNTILFFKTF
jgi:hypothetical protein